MYRRGSNSQLSSADVPYGGFGEGSNSQLSSADVPYGGFGEGSNSQLSSADVPYGGFDSSNSQLLQRFKRASVFVESIKSSLQRMYRMAGRDVGEGSK